MVSAEHSSRRNRGGEESAKGEEERSRINVTRALKEPAGKKRRVDGSIKELRKSRSMLGYRGDNDEECRTLKGKNKAGSRIMRVLACHLCKYYIQDFDSVTSVAGRPAQSSTITMTYNSCFKIKLKMAKNELPRVAFQPWMDDVSVHGWNCVGWCD